MGFNPTKFDVAIFDSDVYDGIAVPASPMTTDEQDANLQDSWQANIFGTRINPFNKIFG